MKSTGLLGDRPTILALHFALTHVKLVRLMPVKESKSDPWPATGCHPSYVSSCAEKYSRNYRFDVTGPRLAHLAASPGSLATSPEPGKSPRSPGTGSISRLDSMRLLFNVTWICGLAAVTNFALCSEQKIDLIEDRLKAIEGLLVKSLQEDRPGPSSSVATCKSSSDASATVFDQDDAATASEGPSSLQAHVQVAQRFAEAAVDVDSDGALTALLRQASDVSQAQRDLQAPAARSPLTYREMPLPPTSAIIDILKKVKEKPPTSFLALRCVISIEHFMDLCRNVFFAIDDYSDVDFIIAVSGLYYLFTERFHTSETDPSWEQYRHYGILCGRALESALTALGAFLPARTDSVQALVLGSSHAIEMSKPWLAWRMVGLAAHLCLTMGWHDAATSSDTEQMRNTKVLLFRHVYAMERGLSLRLGRASVFHDYDTILDSHLGELSLSEPWPKLFSFWVGNASIQGKVYERLYSKAALLASESSLSEHADSLMGELHSLGLESFYVLGTYPPMSLATTLEEVLAVSDKVTYYSTATLICRAKTLKDQSFTFSPDCVDNARKALQAHEECMQITNENSHYRSIYLHWRILHSPFIPFIVIFGNLIKTFMVDDLCRLRSFVDSLQTSTDLSTSVKRLHRISQALCEVGRVCLEKRMQGQQTETSFLGNAGLGQDARGLVFSSSEEEMLDPGFSLETLLYSETDDCFFGPQQVVGPLQLPF
ncbi:hypothetical protein AK830_g438 [Neonectria ditissima]|uniref:Xylanolytic transcriptional activator regulatory domain-containing protein n=1 Tax=Neonectria ditissima TaxID=78410 RepID=A0A0P7C208_9HYPO|nr:hypothetical protein AK830_g438 [Neonectria ditissima]